jgi:hypothetical protein
MFRRVTTGAVAVTAALLACSPTFNWREVRVESTGLKAMFPCKPDHAMRSVDVAGRPVSLQALACDAGGATFAVLFADADPGSAGEFLDHWRAAYFARGRQVFQAVVYAEALRPEFTNPFFSGLAFE